MPQPSDAHSAWNDGDDGDDDDDDGDDDDDDDDDVSTLGFYHFQFQISHFFTVVKLFHMLYSHRGYLGIRRYQGLTFFGFNIVGF